MTFGDDIAAVRTAATRPAYGFTGRSRELVCANVYNLIAPDSRRQLEDIVHGTFLHQELAVVEGRHGSRLVRQARVRNLDASPDGAGRIFVSYHHGPYRLVAGILLARRRPLTILIDDAVARRQGQSLSALLCDGLADLGIAAERFRFRDTADPALLLHLAKDLKRGGDVLVYIDGNTGAHGRGAARERMETIAFLGQRLRVRTGIAMLARLARAAVVPVVATRSVQDPACPAFDFDEPIAPDLPVHDMVQAMWCPLDRAIRRIPHEWEAMRYVHEFLERPCLANHPAASPVRGAEPRIVFDDRRFSVRPGRHGIALFDRRTYRMHAVEGRLAALIRSWCDGATMPTVSAGGGVTMEELDWLTASGIVTPLPASRYSDRGDDR